MEFFGSVENDLGKVTTESRFLPYAAYAPVSLSGELRNDHIDEMLELSLLS